LRLSLSTGRFVRSGRTSIFRQLRTPGLLRPASTHACLLAGAPRGAGGRAARALPARRFHLGTGVQGSAFLFSKSSVVVARRNRPFFGRLSNQPATAARQASRQASEFAEGASPSRTRAGRQNAPPGQAGMHARRRLQVRLGRQADRRLYWYNVHFPHVGSPWRSRRAGKCIFLVKFSKSSFVVARRNLSRRPRNVLASNHGVQVTPAVYPRMGRTGLSWRPAAARKAKLAGHLRPGLGSVCSKFGVDPRLGRYAMARARTGLPRRLPKESNSYSRRLPARVPSSFHTSR